MLHVITTSLTPQAKTFSFPASQDAQVLMTLARERVPTSGAVEERDEEGLIIARDG